MDPLRIAVRVLFAYAFVLAMLRIAGKRTVKQQDLASFVVALIIGDLIDDVLWAEVPMAQFAAGAGTLMLAHLLVTIDEYKRGKRIWRRASDRKAGTA